MSAFNNTSLAQPVSASVSSDNLWCAYDPLDDFLPSTRAAKTGPQVRRRPSPKKPVADLSSSSWKWNNVNFKAQHKKKDNQKIWTRMVDHFNLKNNGLPSMSSSSSSSLSLASSPSPFQMYGATDLSPEQFSWQTADFSSKSSSTEEFVVDEGDSMPQSPVMTLEDIFDFNEFQTAEHQQPLEPVSQPQFQQQQQQQQTIASQKPAESISELEAFFETLAKSQVASDLCSSSSTALHAPSLLTVSLNVHSGLEDFCSQANFSPFTPSFDSNSSSCVCGPLPINGLFFS